MRLQFPNLIRPKQAAKLLARSTPDLKLSTTHEALARSLGYRDWHDLSINPGPLASIAAKSDDAYRIIGEISDATGAADPDVQYALSKARLFGEAWNLQDHLSLRASLWRKRMFGPPGRDRPGTVVRDKAYGSKEPAYLLRPGRPSYLMFDTGRGERADFEVSTPRVPVADFIPSRLWLPYGYWLLQDGSEVLFSRDYIPLWRIADVQTERLDPWIWILEKAEENHFSGPRESVWSKGEARERALARLDRHGIAELPKLVDAMPYLFDDDVDSIGAAVSRMYRQRGEGRVMPAFARLKDSFWAD